MGVLYLLVNVFANQGETILVRRFGRKYGAGGMLFNAVICLFAMIFFLVSDSNGFCFNPDILIYGLINAILYAAGFYFCYVAFAVGNYLLTHTITSMNFLIPVFYGLFILKEKSGVLTYIGLLFSIASVLIMCYARWTNAKNDEKGEGISLKWLISTLIVLFSNGFISVLSKIFQSRFQGVYTNEYMVITLAGSSLSLLIMGLILEGNTLRNSFRQAFLYGMGAGLCNGIKNAANLAVILLIPLSVLTPLRKGIHIVASFLLSHLIYKERYTKLQYFCILLSIISIVLMQLA